MGVEKKRILRSFEQDPRMTQISGNFKIEFLKSHEKTTKVFVKVTSESKIFFGQKSHFLQHQTHFSW